MMNKNSTKLDETGNKRPFKVPEGYFDDLNKRIIDRLDSVKAEVPRKVSLWERTKPVLYLAAMFAGIALMFNVFKNNQASDTNKDQYANSLQKELYAPVLLQEEDFEEFYDYLEYQAIEQNYREAAFISDDL